MKQFLRSLRPFHSVYANDTDAMVPEFWAQEALAILEENMVSANLVYRDYENVIQKFGDTVNVQRPSELKTYRKEVTDDVVIQDISATNIPVRLNHLPHCSFLVRDGEESKAFPDLVETYLKPGVLSMARYVDRAVLAQFNRWVNASSSSRYYYGKLGQLTPSNSIDYLTGVRSVLNTHKAYVNDRNMILTPNAETLLLQTGAFTEANRVGDDGSALREASLGRKFGFDLFMSQNASSVAAASNDLQLLAVNNSSGYAAGIATMTVDGLSGVVIVGNWFTVDGDDVPHQITATTATLGNTTAITFTPALKYAVVNNAVITNYASGQVNQGSAPTGYAAGYAKGIAFDNMTTAPSVGQAVTFGAGTAIYTVIDFIGSDLMLDRPLDVAIADNAAVSPLPRGEYNPVFHRNALALVTRPLAKPRPNIGASSAVIALNGFSCRVTITYQGIKQGTLVTIDMLMGLEVLDYNLGALMLG